MEAYSSHTIDELDRLLLHRELRQMLCLKAGDKVALKIISKIVTLQREADAKDFDSVICQVDELGRITIPTKVKEVLGWKERDAIALYRTDDLLILKAA